MASGKARGIKRVSATTSYSSATTIVIFVGLSVLGLWLLTSKSFTPPQPATVTTTIPTRITTIGNHHHPQTHHSSDPDPVHVDRSTDDTKADEAVVVEEPETKPETKPENAESQPDHGGVKTEATDQQDTKGSDEQDSMEESKKQAALEIQTSEESSMTQKQVVEQIIEEHPNSQINVATNATDHGSDAAEESTESKKSWTTQAHQSCLDNEKVIASIHSRSHHEHRERHCPEDPPTCLVPLTRLWQSIKGTRIG